MDTAIHIRIYEPVPDDSFVEKRSAAVKALRTLYAKAAQPNAVFGLASALIGAAFRDEALPAAVATPIFAALKKQSPALIEHECAVEMPVIGLLAIGSVLRDSIAQGNQYTTPNLLALAVWLAADFLPPHADEKREAMRADLVAAAQARLTKAATAGRERKAIGPLETSLSPEAVAPVLAALRDNAILDREELDLLWWVTGGRSDIVGRSTAGLSAPLKALVTGLEIGAIMRRWPSKAHHNLAIRDICDEPLALTTLLAAISDDRPVIEAWVGATPLLLDAPHVFPLQTALRTGTAAGPSAEQERSLVDWTGRALVERATLSICTTLPAK